LELGSSGKEDQFGTSQNKSNFTTPEIADLQQHIGLTSGMVSVGLICSTTTTTTTTTTVTIVDAV